MNNQAYLIRYGAMGHIGRFTTFPGCPASLARDQIVVLQTHRGIELGEVLVPVDAMTTIAKTEWAHAGSTGNENSSEAPSASVTQPCVLRLASPEDLNRRQQVEELRASRFTLCRRVLQEGNWPWELIDVEPLLDGRATVLHYLGSHQIDVAPVRARFRVACDFDVVLEPVGVDQESEGVESIFHEEDESLAAGCGSGNCGAGGCGSSANITSGHTTNTDETHTGCAPASHAGCASCGISKFRTARVGERN